MQFRDSTDENSAYVIGGVLLTGSALAGTASAAAYAYQANNEGIDVRGTEVGGAFVGEAPVGFTGVGGALLAEPIAPAPEHDFLHRRPCATHVSNIPCGRVVSVTIFQQQVSLSTTTNLHH